MDGSRDPGPGEIWVRQTRPEKVAVEEHGYICSWNDNSRGTHRLVASAAPVT